MKTLTVRLPEPLVADIEAESRGRKISKSDVVRERLERAPRKRRRATSLNAIADLIGSVDGLPTDLTARKKEYLQDMGMARDVLVDAGFVVALLSSRDNHHEWAVTQASEFPPPWSTCEAVLSESFHLLGGRGAPNLGALLRRRALLVAFELADSVEPVVRLIEKYSDVPMSLADACLV